MRKAWNHVICGFLLLTPLIGWGQEAAGLEVRFFELGRDAFGFNSLQPSPRDVRDQLRAKGMTLPAGSEAWFHPETGVLMVKSAPADFDVVNELRQARVAAQGFENVDLSVICLAWRQKDPVASALAEPVTPATLSKIDRRDLQIISRQRLLTRSGARAKIESNGENSPPKSYEGAKEWWSEDWDGPESKAEFEVDPQINLDRKTVSMNFVWDLKLPNAKAAERRLEFKIMTQIDLWTGRPVVVELGTLPGPDPVQLLLIMEVATTPGEVKP